MSAGTVFFGLGSFLNWWYAPIGIIYLWLSVLLARRIRLVQQKGYELKRATPNFAILSWLSALGFGFTVPGMRDGTLEPILGLWFGEFWREMSIALCNPLGITAIGYLGAALGFAISRSRDPRPEEDEGMEEIQMIQHPLQ